MIDNNIDNYIDKYMDLLDLFCCHSNNDILCKKLSYNKNGFCENCIKFIKSEKTKKELFLEKRFLITNSIKNLLEKCANAIGKMNKVGVTLEIYEIIYYNFYFLIVHPKFLIVNIHKIQEFCDNDNDKEYFMKYLDDNKDKKYIYNFMMELINFIKNNNYELSNEMEQESFDKFLNHLKNHIKNYYENIIDNFIETECYETECYETEQTVFDIDNIEKYVFCLDI